MYFNNYTAPEYLMEPMGNPLCKITSGAGVHFYNNSSFSDSKHGKAAWKNARDDENCQHLILIMFCLISTFPISHCGIHY